MLYEVITKKSYSDKPAYGKKSYSDKPSFGKKSYSDKPSYSRNSDLNKKNYARPAAPRVTPREEEAAVTEQQLQVLVSAIATEPVTSLSALAAHAKKRAARETLEHIFADRAVLYAALKAPEPKARKNAARVLGAFANERDRNNFV